MHLVLFAMALFEKNFEYEALMTLSAEKVPNIWFKSYNNQRIMGFRPTNPTIEEMF